MANIMTKRGSLDNIVTYEHFCDDVSDITSIPQDQITLGSIAIALKDGSEEGLKVYIANSQKEWIPLISGSGGGGTIGNVVHICEEGEYNPATGEPTVDTPIPNILYFVPSGDEEPNNMFKEWIYVDDGWELFGSVDAPSGALQSDWEQTNSTSLDFIKNKPFGEISSMSTPLSYDEPFGNQAKTNYETGTEYNVAVSGVYYLGTYWANAVSNFGEAQSLIARLTVNDTVYYPITLTKQVEEDSDYGDRGIYYEYQINQGSGASYASNAIFDDLPIAIYVFVSDEGNVIEHGDVIFIKDMQAENITSCTLEIGNVTIKKIDKKYLPGDIFNPTTGDLTIEGTNLTLGSTTMSEAQLQTLLSLSDATGVGF